MKHHIKTMATLITVTTGICLAPLANAQDDYSASFGNSKNVNTTAGVHVTFPFGGKNSDRVTDRARFGLMLNMTREYNDRNFYTPRRVKTSLLDFGMQFNGQPTMLMGGEDIYTPLFTPLNAHEDGQANTGSKNTLLIIAGGTLAVGAAIALAGGNSSNDNDNDNDNGNDNDGDND